MGNRFSRRGAAGQLGPGEQKEVGSDSDNQVPSDKHARAAASLLRPQTGFSCVTATSNGRLVLRSPASLPPDGSRQLQPDVVRPMFVRLADSRFLPDKRVMASANRRRATPGGLRAGSCASPSKSRPFHSHRNDLARSGHCSPATQPSA